MKKLFVCTLSLILAVLFLTEVAASAKNSQSQNSGVVNTLEVGCKYPVAAESVIVYENLGVRKIGAANPLELTYSIGYRFNMVSLSLGSGILYETVDLRSIDDEMVSEYSDSGVEYSNVNVPLFLDMRMSISEKKFQPLLSLRGGLYLLCGSKAMLEGGVGCNYKLNNRCNLYVMATAAMYPSLWGASGESPAMGRRNTFAPGIKVGFSL